VLWNCLAYFNSCVNPIIYNRTSKEFTSKEFRDAFLEACGCLRGDRARSNSTELHAADGRRASAVNRVTPDGRRRASCVSAAVTYSPSPAAAGPKHLLAQNATTTMTTSNTLTVQPPTSQQPN